MASFPPAKDVTFAGCPDDGLFLIQGFSGGGLLLGRILGTGFPERTPVNLAPTALDVTLTHALIAPEMIEKPARSLGGCWRVVHTSQDS
jgi:hypothetical protein